MRHYPRGFYAALGLQIAAARDGVGADFRPFASAPADPRVLFPEARWDEAPRPAIAPHAIIVAWGDPPSDD